MTLLERELIGRQASGTNFGNVRRQGRALEQMPLANRAHAVWGRVKSLLGEDIEFLPLGHLRVCYTHEQAAKLEEHARLARPMGLDLELLSADMLRQRYGFFSQEVVAGSLSPLDGHANPRLAGPAFGRGGGRASADILEHQEVVHIEKVGDDFVAHTAAGKTFRAAQMLVASGAWSNKQAAAFNEPVPMEARGPQMGVTEPVPYAIGPSIGVSSPVEEEGLYFRQITRGNIVFGGGLKGPASTRNDPCRRQAGQHLAPAPRAAAFRAGHGQAAIAARLERHRGLCRRLASGDGPERAMPGLHYAFGFNGEGFAISLGVGETMAELLATGKTVTPIEAFSIGRFAQA
ncbi:FAD-binding oxidoreductase [Polaromonas sp. P1-6]|nr:FAD-binding oxidoreductase [Polaromonas sp. P1-6]